MLPNTATDNLKFKDDYPMENKDQKFDKKEYDKQYRNENFKQIAYRYRCADIDYIKDFAKQRGLSIPQAVLKAFRYIDENDIDLDT